MSVSLSTRATRSISGPMLVPPAEEWPHLHAVVDAFVASAGPIPPLALDELSDLASKLLGDSHLPEAYGAFIQVLINNALWREVVASIPFARRTLLLPPCLRSSATCRATFDEYGLLCESCGQCCIASLTHEAEELGYAVLVAEGTSIVERLLSQGDIDAVIGVSCMPSLERSFPRLANLAVPGLAIPLLQEGCRDTTVVEEWVRNALRVTSSAPPPLDFHELHATVDSWFEASSLRAILGAETGDVARIGVEWLAKSGKRWRPFLTLAAYSALAHERSVSPNAPIARLAVAVECLHKASLIFDDIQDGDRLRYGERTPHDLYGMPVAMTAALHLLGQGYRLIAGCGASPSQIEEMMRLTSSGHCDLCLGQGAELWWTRHPRKLSSAEVLDIFRNKTGPAFEVGLRLGAILAGATPEQHAVLSDFSRSLGIAYQIRDDIDDFAGGTGHGDIDAGRLSILAALAAEQSPQADLPGSPEAQRKSIMATGAVDLARAAQDEHRAHALAALQKLRHRELKLLLCRIAGAMCGG